MDLLDNKLVRKYFSCECQPQEPAWFTHPGSCYSKRAIAVLRAMQEPIKKDERFIWFDFCTGKWTEGESPIDYEARPDHLRIPERFQPKGGCHIQEKFPTCSCKHCLGGCPHNQPKRECDCTQGLCRHGNFVSVKSDKLPTG